MKYKLLSNLVLLSVLGGIPDRKKAMFYSIIVRAMGQPLIMLPLTSIATSGIEKEQASSASGLFNMMRNLGGSIGIAVLGTLLTKREQFHSNRLGDAVSIYSPETQERLNQLTQFL